MANLVFLGLSMGNMPENASFISGSLNLAAIFLIPISSMISCNRIFTKIRLEDVVSSSFMCTTWSTAQEMPSDASK